MEKLVVTNTRPNLCSLGMGKGKKPVSFKPGENEFTDEGEIRAILKHGSFKAYCASGWLKFNKTE